MSKHSNKFVIFHIINVLLWRIQGSLRWLGRVRRMEDGRIPKDILYGELALGGG